MLSKYERLPLLQQRRFFWNTFIFIFNKWHDVWCLSSSGLLHKGVIIIATSYTALIFFGTSSQNIEKHHSWMQLKDEPGEHQQTKDQILLQVSKTFHFCAPVLWCVTGTELSLKTPEVICLRPRLWTCLFLFFLKWHVALTKPIWKCSLSFVESVASVEVALILDLPLRSMKTVIYSTLVPILALVYVRQTVFIRMEALGSPLLARTITETIPWWGLCSFRWQMAIDFSYLLNSFMGRA